MKKKIANKKSTTIKRTNKKVQSPVIATPADQDVIGLLTVLVQKLTSFEAKIDTVLSRIPAQPIIAPKPQLPIVPPVVPGAFTPNKPKQASRPMHKAVCADCAMDCEVPFKPREDRPVYCKGCFAKRKAKGAFRPQQPEKPKEVLPINVAPVEKPKEAKPAQSPQKKKPAEKKKKANRK